MQAEHIPVFDENVESSIVQGFTRTSDIFGGHIRKDLDSYLALIRRKIQEKCGTTQELIQQIRRNKIGESGHVTPNEFRYTLIKFGVILPQPLVDRIFNVFDSDRSGTMDFDEFAMWIMNAEFRPLDEEAEKKKKPQSKPSSMVREKLRAKLESMMKLHKPVFDSLKHSISFQEWISMVGRLNMSITEREARTIFMLFDKQDTGFIAPKQMRHWVGAGNFQFPPDSAKSKNPELGRITLSNAVFKVAGKDVEALHRSFKHLPRGEKVRISFEEFRRCLLGNGLGRNILEAKQLFMSLDPENRMTADIDMLMNWVEKAPKVTEGASTLVKKEKARFVFNSHADRRLREAIRKCYHDFKAAVEATDKQSTGYITVEALHKILMKFCIPLSFQDFRLIIENVHKVGNGGQVNYVHFLDCYNPKHGIHQLSGVKGGMRALSTSQSTSSLSNSAGMTQPEMEASTSSENRADTASMNRSKSTAGLSINDNMRKIDPTGELRRIWQRVLRECHKHDPDRTGCVSRVNFISALDIANVDKSMSAQSMARLADQFDAGHGLVNYLACFRIYLTSMTANAQAMLKESKAPITSKTRKIGALHPWEFEYSRAERHAEPYWSQAAASAKDLSIVPKPAVKVPSSLVKSAFDLSSEEKDALIRSYPEKVAGACAKVFKQIGNPATWKKLRNEMKSHQINSQRGTLLTTNFYKLMESYNVKLSISDMGAVVRYFRGLGNQDVIKYNDFTRMCMVVGGASP